MSEGIVKAIEDALRHFQIIKNNHRSEKHWNIE